MSDLRTAAQAVSDAWIAARRLRQEDPTGEASAVQLAVKKMQAELAKSDLLAAAERRVIDTVKCLMQLEADYRDSPCAPSQAAIDEEMEALREAAKDLFKEEKAAKLGGMKG